MRMATKILMVAVAMLISGCGDGDEGTITNLGESEMSSTAPGATSTSTPPDVTACHVEGGLSSQGSEDVTVELNEWNVIASPTEVAAGIVSFNAENTGAEPHELVIVKGESAETLPTDPETGAMAEEQLPDGALVGEIEPFPSGGRCQGNFALEAGDYVLLCNITEQEGGETESHFAEGMHTSFTAKAS